MKYKNAIAVSSIFIIITSLVPPTFVLGINSSEPVGLNEDLPLDINIKLWGFGSDYNSIRSGLFDKLPTQALYESFNPNSLEIHPYSFHAANNWRQLYSSLNFEIEQTQPNFGFYSTNNAMTNFTEDHTFNPVDLTYINETGEYDSTTGVEIDLYGFSSSLEQFNENYGYTIHIMNFDFINEHINNTGQKHWYTVGPIYSPDLIEDSRNLGLVGNKGIFYDPTGFAPSYENESYSEIKDDMAELTQFLEVRINHLVERVILGSPLGINYYAYPQKVHVANVVAIESNADQNSRIVGTQISVSNNKIQNSISDLFKFQEIDYSYKSVSLSALSLFNLDVIGIGGSKIELTPQNTESLKNNIRDGFYTDYPYGYYLLILTVLDEDGREFYMVNDDGLELNYTHQFLGFGLVNQRNMQLLDGNEISNYVASKDILNVLGKMLGFADLDWLSSQIPSPMSTGFVPESWELNYTTFEEQSLARRFGLFYRVSAIENLRHYRNELRNSIWRWMDSSGLDDAELLILKGDTEYGKGNYTEAARLYLQAFNLWEDTRDSINLNIIVLINSIYLLAFLIFAYMVLDIARTYLITKKDLFEKYDIDESKENEEV